VPTLSDLSAIFDKIILDLYPEHSVSVSFYPLAEDGPYDLASDSCIRLGRSLQLEPTRIGRNIISRLPGPLQECCSLAEEYLWFRLPPSPDWLLAKDDLTAWLPSAPVLSALSPLEFFPGPAGFVRICALAAVQMAVLRNYNRQADRLLGIASAVSPATPGLASFFGQCLELCQETRLSQADSLRRFCASLEEHMDKYVLLWTISPLLNRPDFADWLGRNRPRFLELRLKYIDPDWHLECDQEFSVEVLTSLSGKDLRRAALHLATGDRAWELDLGSLLRNDAYGMLDRLQALALRLGRSKLEPSAGPPNDRESLILSSGWGRRLALDARFLGAHLALAVAKGEVMGLMRVLLRLINSADHTLNLPGLRGLLGGGGGSQEDRWIISSIGQAVSDMLKVFDS
jgi:hypothetical protein